MLDQMMLKQEAALLAKSDGCSVWQCRNGSGDGTMTCYDIFPGVQLLFNDFHMEYVDSEFKSSKNMLAIDHCREGRMEYKVDQNTFSYVSAGDVKLDRRIMHTGRFVFPSGHFHGLTIAVDLETIEQTLPLEIKDISIDFGMMIRKYLLEYKPKVIRNVESIQHIMMEMYQVPEKIKFSYWKLKILEVMLCLEVLELPEKQEETPYFYKTQVEKVKAIHSFLSENMAEKYTQEELAKQFDISLTLMKNCFKSIYGVSIGTWLTGYRMNRAAELLISEKEMSVSEIAGHVGYDSSSKFAAVFKKTMNMTPIEYRNAIR